MEAIGRWSLVTAIAPVAWGTTYFVTREALPADHPLYGAAIRALPAGLLLLLVARTLPRGAWWWRSIVLGTLNCGAFFALVYLAAQLLPTSVASMVMATSPVAMMLAAWAAVAERPRVPAVAGAGLGIAGVVLMLAGGAGTVNPWGVVASVTAMAMSSAGFVLARTWTAADRVDVLPATAWQLVAGGLVLLPFAVLVEGAPPALGATAAAGFAYVSVVCTAVAFVAWFAGLRRVPAGTVGLIGLLNPVTGVLLGTALADERLDGRQWLGIALVLTGVLLGQPAPARLRRATRRLRARRPGHGSSAQPSWTPRLCHATRGRAPVPMVRTGVNEPAGVRFGAVPPTPNVHFGPAFGSHRHGHSETVRVRVDTERERPS
ncbi:MAG TPA: EamA family transporter [Pseudonocardiaceae bacterium]